MVAKLDLHGSPDEVLCFLQIIPVESSWSTVCCLFVLPNRGVAFGLCVLHVYMTWCCHLRPPGFALRVPRSPSPRRSGGVDQVPCLIRLTRRASIILLCLIISGAGTHGDVVTSSLNTHGDPSMNCRRRRSMVEVLFAFDRGLSRLASRGIGIVVVPSGIQFSPFAALTGRRFTLIGAQCCGPRLHGMFLLRHVIHSFGFLSWSRPRILLRAEVLRSTCCVVC